MCKEAGTDYQVQTSLKATVSMDRQPNTGLNSPTNVIFNFDKKMRNRT